MLGQQSSVWLLAVTLLLILTCNCRIVAARTATGSTAQQLTAAQAKDGGGGGGDGVGKPSDSGSNVFWSHLSQAYSIYKTCAHDNLSVCLKIKLLTGLQRVLRSAKVLKLMEGVQFVKSSSDVDDDAMTTTTPRDGSGGAAAAKTLTFTSEKELEAVLPRGADAKEQVLQSMIAREVSNLLQNFTLQVKFPYVRNAVTADDDDNDSNSNAAEGRGRKRKKGGGGAMIMIPLLLGGTFIPIAYGALAMLAGKALIVSKLALVLASIIGLKKLLGGGHGKESHEVVVSGGHSDWGRDMDLAYNGWKPGKENVKSA